MRVLLLNNRVAPDGGAETMVTLVHDLLAGAGHEVLRVGAREAESARPRVYSLAHRRALAQLLRRWRPDVAHLHNVYETLTLSVLDALKEARIPTVITLHDFRAVCPAGTLLAPDGQCRRCVGAGNFGHALAHACLHGSRRRTARAAAEAAVNRCAASTPKRR